ncbi:MAG: hypothetical protein KTR18_03650 [Acidiferrobacterales bacterium]|nr:hypothetical protein [Acidiferrobacterales bacterium]
MQYPSIFRQWYWIWLVSAAFIVVMVMYFLTKYPAWLHYSYRGVSLTHEMSYGVWWSGIGLLMSGIIFARVGMLSLAQGITVWPWFILALAMVALCFDEIGSLHETVARAAGWEGLLPFAAIFGIGFVASLANLAKRPALRIIVVLISIGIGIFAMVAGLEFIEHDPTFLHPFWRRARLVGEESIELVAIGILITAGLMAMKRAGDTDRSFLNATRVVEYLYLMPTLVFLLFALQMLVTLTVIVPNYTFFPEGNPSALFPVSLFFCLGILARLEARNGEYALFWKIQAVLFFLTSMNQMYNLNIFLNNLLLTEIQVFVRAPFSWVITLVPFLTLSWFALRNNSMKKMEVIQYLLVFFLFGLIVVSEMRLRFRVEYLYLAFSSIVAYSCYQLQQRMKCGTRHI